MQSTGQRQVMQMLDDSDGVLSSSYAVLSCTSGYTNVGGSLNVTCSADGAWSPFPNCASDRQPTTAIPTDASACSYSAGMRIIANGYASNWKGLMLSTAGPAVSGSFVDYQCVPPYTVSGNSRMTCENGAWSSQPTCIGEFQQRTFLQCAPIFSFISTCRSTERSSNNSITITMHRYTVCPQCLRIEYNAD